MKVALIHSTPQPPREGIGTHVLRLAQALRERGFQPTILTRGDGRRMHRHEIDGIPVLKPRFVRLYPIHVHLHRRPMQRALDAAGRFDVVHLHAPLPPPVATSPSVLTFHTPLLGDVRSVPLTEPFALRLRLQLPVSVRLEHRLIRGAGAVTTVSHSMRQALAEYGLTESDVRVVPNGVDTRSIRYRDDGRDPMQLLYVGRLAPRKGLPDLVEVIARLRERSSDVQLHIVGTGPLDARLRRLARRSDVQDAVRFHGYLPREELDVLWRLCGMFVHLPRYEGMPTSLLEAMAHGVPIVTTDAPGTRDLVEDGRDGVLVPVSDPAAAAAAIQGLLEDGRTRRRLARAARARAERYHDWRRVAAGYEAVYAEAMP